MHNSANTLKTAPAIAVQLSYLGMCIFWQLINVGLIAAEQQPLGPAASLVAVAAMIVVAILLVISVRRFIWLYAGLSLLLALGALHAIYGAFIGAADNWPSTYFRVIGAAINGVGVIGAALACQLVIRSRRRKR